MADNDFLAGIKIDKMIKSNNEQLTNTLKGEFDTIARTAKDILKLEISSAKKLDSIDSNTSNLNSMDKTISRMYDLQKAQFKLQGLRDKDMSKSLDSLLHKHDARINNLLSKMGKSEKKVNTTKDFFKREDSNQDTEDLLNKINSGISSLVKNGAKKAKGFLDWLGLSAGGLLAMGGLVGYLLTGKKELLNNVAKGLRYTIMSGFSLLKTGFKTLFGNGGIVKTIRAGLTKALDVGAILKNSPLDEISKVALKIGGVITGVTKALNPITTLTKSFDSLVKFGTGIGTIVKTFGTLFKSGGLKAVAGGALAGLKTGGKSALKKVPVVGSIMGAIFGINRIRKGDIAGGLLEFASGMSSMIPGVGIPLGLAIDAFLLVRDLKGAGKNNNASNGTVSNAPNAISGGDTKMVESIVNNAQKGDGGYDVSDDYVAKQNKFYLGINDNRKSKSIWSKLFSKKKSKPTFRPSTVGKDIGFNGGDKGGYNKTADYVKNSQHAHSVKLNGAKNFRPDLMGVNPIMRDRFMKMADDFYTMSGGGQFLVNSGKRSGGSSTHNYGYAIDVNTINPDGSMGYVPDTLLEKYGFHKPLLHLKSWYGKSKDEPWHIEPYPGEKAYGGPRNTLAPDQPYRKGVLLKGKNGYDSAVNVNAPKGDKGDGGYNLPQGTVDRKVASNAPLDMKLSDADIDKLAKAFGKQIKENTPVAKTKVVQSGSANGRGNL